jgi:hypothetical protein
MDGGIEPLHFPQEKAESGHPNCWQKRLLLGRKQHSLELLRDHAAVENPGSCRHPPSLLKRPSDTCGL